jgi:hypothetical protein
MNGISVKPQLFTVYPSDQSVWWRCPNCSQFALFECDSTFYLDMTSCADGFPVRPDVKKSWILIAVCEKRLQVAPPFTKSSTVLTADRLQFDDRKWRGSVRLLPIRKLRNKDRLKIGGIEKVIGPICQIWTEWIVEKENSRGNRIRKWIQIDSLLRNDKRGKLTMREIEWINGRERISQWFRCFLRLAKPLIFQSRRTRKEGRKDFRSWYWMVFETIGNSESGKYDRIQRNGVVYSDDNPSCIYVFFCFGPSSRLTADRLQFEDRKWRVRIRGVSRSETQGSDAKIWL